MRRLENAGDRAQDCGYLEIAEGYREQADLLCPS